MTAELEKDSFLEGMTKHIRIKLVMWKLKGKIDDTKEHINKGTPKRNSVKYMGIVNIVKLHVRRRDLRRQGPAHEKAGVRRLDGSKPVRHG